MPCYKPMSAFKCANGEVVFSELRRYNIIANLTLPCGQCIGCKLERSRVWGMRCVHESKMHKNNAFITLTYADEHLPERKQLQHEDFVKFMKRLRKQIAPTRARFYMGGEYGPQNDRPHFHACIFGHDFHDRQYHSTTGSGEKIYRSNQLEKLWTNGYSSTANLTFQSAAYIARYCLQKVTGDLAEEHYKRYDHLGEYQLNPEYNHMSLKPGIGATWFKTYQADVVTFDYVVINGKRCKPPKYYDLLYGETNPDELEHIKYMRMERAKEHAIDNTDERLKVREQVTKAAISQLKRGNLK